MSKTLVLYYHHVDVGGPDYTWISPDELRAQLTWVMERYAPISMEKAAAGTEGFVVTFDDGYKDVLIAADVLESLGLQGAFFILPAFVGRRSSFGRLGLDVEHASLQSLRELCDRGHVIGSHGMTHRDLTALSDGEVLWEMDASKRALEEACSRPIDYFAYPYGICDSRTTQICAGVYQAAWSTGSTKAAAGKSDRHALGRSYLVGPEGDYFRHD